MSAEKLAEALRLLRDAVRAQNRAGIAWPAPVFAQMMDGLARADALLDGPGAATVQQEQAGEAVATVGSWWNGDEGFSLVQFNGVRPAPGTKLYTHLAANVQPKWMAGAVERVMDHRAHWRTAIVMMRDFGHLLAGKDGDADRTDWELVRKEFESALDALAAIQQSPRRRRSMSAEKLAEALRKIAEYSMSQFSSHADMAAQCVDDAAKALAAHSAEQEQAGETVGEAGTMPGTSGFTMACFHANKVPVGTKLYTRPQQPLSDEQIAVLKFLDGSGLLRGAGYGCLPYGERRPFWWRRQLGDAFPQIRAHGITKDTK